MYRKFFPSLVLLALFVLGCEKNQLDQERFTFTPKGYAPADEQEAKRNVMGLIDRMKNPKTALRGGGESGGIDIEEAKWTMEATGNYMWNNNLALYTVSEVITEQLTIDNVFENGQVLLSASDMAEKFGDFTTDAQTELTPAKRMAAVDIEIADVSAAQTIFKVKKVITENRNYQCTNVNNMWGESNINYVNGHTEWCVNNLMLPPYIQNPECFYPDIFVVSFEGYWISPSGLDPNLVLGINGRACTDDNDCLHGANTEYLYINAQQFVSEQADITVEILDDIQTGIWGNGGINDPIPMGGIPEPILVDLSVFHSTWNPPSNPNVTFHWYQMAVSNAFYGFGATYCW